MPFSAPSGIDRHHTINSPPREPLSEVVCTEDGRDGAFVAFGGIRCVDRPHRRPSSISVLGFAGGTSTRRARAGRAGGGSTQATVWAQRMGGITVNELMTPCAPARPTAKTNQEGGIQRVTDITGFGTLEAQAWSLPAPQGLMSAHGPGRRRRGS